jgi:DNA-directed RNA polymerase subunit M/transcription elongation factor TFIIS
VEVMVDESIDVAVETTFRAICPSCKQPTVFYFIGKTEAEQDSIKHYYCSKCETSLGLRYIQQYNKEGEENGSRSN